MATVKVFMSFIVQGLLHVLGATIRVLVLRLAKLIDSSINSTKMIIVTDLQIIDYSISVAVTFPCLS